MMKAMGSGKRGPLAGIAQAMGFGGGAGAVAGADEGDGRKDAEWRAAGRHAEFAEGSSRRPAPGPAEFAGLTGLCGKPTLPGLGGFPGKKK